MEVFPVIYSRTYYMDYAPDFFICPSLFDNDTIEIFRGYILDALKYPNLMEETRRVIISEEGCTVLGYVCELKKFAEHRNKDANLQKYTYDNKGREIISFVGIAFENSELLKDYIPENINEIIYNVFLKFISDDDKWLSKDINHYVVNSFDIPIVKYIKQNSVQGKIECYNKKIYPSNEENDQELFLRIVANNAGYKKRYSFCSDYYGIESVKDSDFCILTSKYMDKIQKFYETELNEVKVLEKKQSSRFFFTVKKRKKLVIIVCVIILIVIITICINRKDNKQVSKIDMSKPGAHKITSNVDAIYRNDKIETYFQYIDACGQILAKYKKEIEFVENMYAKLRKEKMQFMNVEIGKLKKVLEKEGIPSELVITWLDEIKHNFDDSFAASERILGDYSIVSIEEMQSKIRKLINE